jgi:ribosomal protein S12 methylthiotransferase accessory factor YcaO
MKNNKWWSDDCQGKLEESRRKTYSDTKHLPGTRHGLRIQNLTHQAKNGLCKEAVTVAVTHYRLVLPEICL